MPSPTPLRRLLSRTPIRTFVLMPILVAAFELAWARGRLAVEQ